MIRALKTMIYCPILMRTTKILLGGFIALLLAPGCGLDSGFDGNLPANQPPDTSISVSPPNLDAASFRVHFFWVGDDSDGTVEGFEWRISENGGDGIVDREDTLGLPWHFTTINDSTFVVSADLDSFPDDVADSNQSDSTYRHWQTHTLFVRAVDNENAPDPTPAHESFTATTLAPKITIDYPSRVITTTCLASTRALTFGWNIYDPDDPQSETNAVRYVLLDLDELPPPLDELIHLDENECLTQSSYRSLNPFALLPDGEWGRWISFDAPGDSGRTVTFPLVDSYHRLLFAVQARDEAGAVTPTFDWNVNVRHLRTTTGHSPLLTVSDRFLGSSAFTGKNVVVSKKIVAEQPVAFEWSGDGSSYGGIVRGYRYGWDIQDVNDEEDPGWSVGWGSQWTNTPVQTFHGGDHVFVVQARDNAGAVTRVAYNLTVIPIPHPEQQRNLLLIDDWGWQNTSNELALQQRWLATWSAHLEGTLQDWNPKVDILKVNLEPQRCDFETIGFYKSVIWFTKGSGDNSSLRRNTFPLKGPAYNWMELYMKKVGNVLLTGPLASQGSIAGTVRSYPIVYPQFDVSYLDWPLNDWCLEITDMIRPAMGSIECERTIPARTEQCDRLTTAVVPESFYQSHPSARGVLETLPPSVDRLDDNPLFKFPFEEFYNRNVTCRAVTVSLRPCQKTMFELRAARDDIDPRTGEPLVADPEEVCQPQLQERSILDRVPVGLAVSTYSSTKPKPGSEDFLWGFHPLAFGFAKMQTALVWILRDNWGLPVSNN